MRLEILRHHQRGVETWLPLNVLEMSSQHRAAMEIHLHAVRLFQPVIL
jgi:hypothetical protein